MTNQTKNQKGFAGILVLVVIVAIVTVAAVILLKQNGSVTQQTAQNAPAISNSSDLDTASSNLDNTSTTQLDTELNQVSADASTF